MQEQDPSERFRFVLAIALSCLVYIVWMKVYGPSFSPAEKPDRVVDRLDWGEESETEPTRSPLKPIENEKTVKVEEVAASPLSETLLGTLDEEDRKARRRPESRVEPRYGDGEEIVVLENKRLFMRWSTVGAQLIELRCKTHLKENPDRTGEDWANSAENWLPLLRRGDDGTGNFGCFGVREDRGLTTRPWLRLQSDDRVLRFRIQTSDGIVITKSISLKPNENRFRIEYVLELAPGIDRYDLGRIVFVGPVGIARESMDEGYLQGGVGWKEAGDRHEMELVGVDKDPLARSGVTVDWAGVLGKYFGVLAQFEGFEPTAVVQTFQRSERPVGDPEAKPKDQSNLMAFAMRSMSTLRSGESQKVVLTVHAASRAELSGDPRFDGVEDFGFFGWVVSPILGILQFLHGFLGNWGWSIILLTFFVKVGLHPLTKKSQVSMHTYSSKMKEFKPEFDRIREVYKDDRQKLNEEVMKLYKRHGVNPVPVGGCLPIFIQMPIFFGLFTAFRQSILLRQSTFFWVEDLSQPDRFHSFEGFSLPLVGSDLNLLPIIMTVLWLIQSQLQPKSEDPQARQQQKIMAWMPLIFGAMFYSMASGLVLYWLTSNAIGIVEQFYIRRHLKEMGIGSAAAPATAGASLANAGETPSEGSSSKPEAFSSSGPRKVPAHRMRQTGRKRRKKK
ncbi:MAG: membrane protein insertase YidC [Planctomycetota bacterium]|nr:membrane protein insertase YidC [Planctomycetota bacterium]